MLESVLFTMHVALRHAFRVFGPRATRAGELRQLRHIGLLGPQGGARIFFSARYVHIRFPRFPLGPMDTSACLDTTADRLYTLCTAVIICNTGQWPLSARRPQQHDRTLQRALTRLCCSQQPAQPAAPQSPPCLSRAAPPGQTCARRNLRLGPSSAPPRARCTLDARCADAHAHREALRGGPLSPRQACPTSRRLAKCGRATDHHVALAP
jgi:hypothetical protein